MSLLKQGDHRALRIGSIAHSPELLAFLTQLQDCYLEIAWTSSGPDHQEIIGLILKANPIILEGVYIKFISPAEVRWGNTGPLARWPPAPAKREGE